MFNDSTKDSNKAKKSHFFQSGILSQNYTTKQKNLTVCNQPQLIPVAFDPSI